jgi:hypothetical protein
MASDRAIGRYRTWYRRLLRLYPRAFRLRFAEPMTQTFTDLARERGRTNGSLIGFVAWTFAETSAGIIRENLAQMTMQTKNYLRWVVITGVVLAVPALVMALGIGIYDPGSGDDGLNWGLMDFAIVGVLVLGSGILYEYASSRLGGTPAHRAAAGIAVLAGLGLIWVNLAVGMMDVESGNLLYILVLFVALVGAAAARFAPREASVAMFAAAGAHLLVAAIGFVAGLGPTLLADAFFVGAWIASGLLFRQAGGQASPSATSNSAYQ